MAHLEKPPIALGLSFNGETDWCQAPASGVGIKEELTLVVWTRPSEQIFGAYEDHKDIVASQCLGGGGFWRISTRGGFNTTNLLTLQIGWIAGVDTWWPPPNAMAVINEWNHLVLVLNRNTGKASFYRNGEFIAETSVSVGTKPTTSYVNIARDCAGYYKGIIGEVRIYNRALTPTEISDLYNIRRNIMEDCALRLGPIGLVRGTGTQWLDDSPYKNHGTIYGAKRVRCCHCNIVRNYGT